MAQHFRMEPRWLDDLLTLWIRHRLREATRGLGFPSVNASCKENIPTQAESYEPTGYCGQDFRDLETAWEKLEHRHQCALKMVYMPWTRDAMQWEMSESYGQRTERTYRNWAHEAMAELASKMDRIKEAA